MGNVRLNKKKCQQGLDGMNLEFSFGVADMENLYLPQEELKNKAGNTIVRLDCISGKVRAYVNAVHCIRPSNVKPFGVADAIKLELVKGRVTDFIQEYLQKHLKGRYSEEVIQNMTVKALEVNITMLCVGGATPSDVISLLDLALDKTTIHRRRKRQTKYAKVNTGCLFSKAKEYRLKVYDKTEEQHQKGNPLVEKNLLRIEVVFIDRSLRRMFGERRGLLDVLSVQAIETMCWEYKQVLEQDIINGSVKPCLKNCVAQLLKSLQSAETGHEISAAIAQCKELIPDIEVLRKALKRWYEWRGIKDISKQIICHYRKRNFRFPEGVIKTIKVFHDAAG